MLKIKDNIDLTELEKFGFNKCGKNYEQFFGDETICVRCDNRRLYIETHNMWDIAEDSFGLLHDLIKADMVEKVENLNEI